MSITPESLRRFIARAHHHLSVSQITPRRVIVSQFIQRRRLSLDTTQRHATNEPIDSQLINRSAQIKSWTPPQVPQSITTQARGIPTPHNSLPILCPGCGALAHETDTTEPGYYSRTRKAVKTYLREPGKQQQINHDKIEVHKSERTGDEPEQQTPPANVQTGEIQLQSKLKSDQIDEFIPTPVCDRCHDLMYNSKGTPIAHPSLQDLADSIAESPFSRNHVYHVLDAADFPMSLIPSIYESLSLARPRSQNRRSQQSFSRKSTVSFIITRSDLLAPTKDAVDRMKPYFESVLRAALGRIGKTMRLGNVHLVSAKRGWWASEIKSEIWERGGGNWMIGKFNVGKSNLFEVLFPKGSGERALGYSELQQQQPEENMNELINNSPLAEDSLLPPLQPETPFPVLPLVSSLPGTTASPIRLSFGGHRGELIDLPGLARGDLDRHVQDDHKLDLVMMSRPNVEQHNIKPGQSLLLGGGLIRITPFLDSNDPSTVLMAYPFVPIHAHITSTEKAIGTQLQERESGIKSILAAEAGTQMTSAGTFELDYDVTKYRAGPLLRAGVDASRLPFTVFSTEIVIEGVGWVELVCQVRKRRNTSPSQPNDVSRTLFSLAQPHVPDESSTDTGRDFKPFASEIPETPLQVDPAFPRVEVFTPDGQHVMQRRPLGAWQVWQNGRKALQRTKAAGRPRKSMKGAKRQMKQKMTAAP